MASTIRKLLDLFEPGERWKLTLIVLAMIVTGLLQTAGVASIMPFVGLVANPDLVHENDLLNRIFQGLGFASTSGFLVFTGFAVLGLFAAANAFMGLTTWAMYRFVWNTHHRLTLRLLGRYLEKPYEYFIDRHTARLSKTLLGEVKEVVRGVMMPAMQVLAKSIAALMVIALLVAVDPMVALVVALVLGSAYAVIYLAVRRRQRELGARRLAGQENRFRIASEAFGGIKDVKIFGRERQFLRRFEQPSSDYSRTQASNAAVREIPEYALETLAFGGIIVVLLFLLQTRGALDDVLPLIALYAMAGHRLMPAFHRIFAGLAQIRYKVVALEELHEDLRGPSHELPRSTPVAETPGLGPGSHVEFRGVSFQYPEAHRPALDGVDLVIPAQSKVGLVGPTGCGKTTLVDLLLGLLRPTEGEIRVDGKPLEEAHLADWRSKVGYVPQSVFLVDDTVTRNIAFGIPDEEIDQAAVERAARTAHLHEFVSRLPRGYETLVGERGVSLSGGELQRIGIARALYPDPELLVMDEATSALDTVTEEAVMMATRELAADRTIVLIAHRLSTVEGCDLLYLMEGGRVMASGTYGELADANPTFQQMAGLR